MWDAMEQHQRDVDEYIRNLKDENDRLREGLRRLHTWASKWLQVPPDLNRDVNALLNPEGQSDPVSLDQKMEDEIAQLKAELAEIRATGVEDDQCGEYHGWMEQKVGRLLGERDAVLSELEYARKERAEFYAKVKFLDKGLVEVEAERDRLREALRRLEWVDDGAEPDADGKRIQWCPACEQVPELRWGLTQADVGHKPDCWLNALLDQK